jgi:hypothetical protein
MVVVAVCAACGGRESVSALTPDAGFADGHVVVDRCPNDTEQTVLATVPGGHFGSVLAVRGGVVYFAASGGANNTDGVVLSVPRCGGPVTTLASGQVDPEAIAVDDANLYWGNVGDDNSGVNKGALVRSPLDGGALTVLSDAGVDTGNVTTDGRYLYSTATNWYSADAGYFFGAWRQPVGGGPVTTLFTVPSYVYYVVVDATYAYVSQANGVNGSLHILRVPVSGGTPVALAPTNVDYPGILAVDGTNLYYQGGGQLTRLPTSGGPPVVLAPASASGIATDGTSVYWVEGDGTKIVQSALKRIPASGGTVVTLSTSVGLAVAVDDTYVYWLNLGELLRMPK